MTTNQPEVNGQWAPQFDRVIEAFLENFAERDEVGATFCLVKDGEVLIDVWAGHLDSERTRPWKEDTVVNVYSSTKTMAALCALVLADRGELDLAAPVARYWPEFAGAGKERITTAHFLSHSAGLSGFEGEPFTLEQVCDHEYCAAHLAGQTPWWEPGTASGYHAITQGYLIAEVVRRITGQTLGAFFRTEIAAPLDADFHIGVPDDVMPRIGNLIPPASAELGVGILDQESVAARTFANPPLNATDSHKDVWRRAEIPAANGHGNARAIARIQGTLAADGEAFGVRLLSAAGARRALEPQVSGQDLVLGVPITFGMGYGIADDKMPVSPSAAACFWGGWGGSTVMVDFDERMSFSYVMNRMEPGALGDLRGIALNRAVYECLADQ